MNLTPKKICSHIGLGFALMMVSWMVCSALMSGISAVFFPVFYNSKWGLWLLNDIPLYSVGLPLFCLVTRALVDKNQPAPQPRGRLSLWQLVLLALLCLGATYAINILSAMLVTLIDNLLNKPPIGPLDELLDKSGALQNFLFGVCVPAVGEEFTFRYLLRRRLRGCSDGTYMLFSGLCFAVFHGNLSQLFYAFALGAIFAWAYLYTGRLWVPMLMHFIVNCMGIIVMPALVLDETKMVPVVLLVFALIIIGIVIFALHIARVRRTLQGPTAPGWPYRRPKAAPPNAFESQQHGAAAWQPPASAYGAQGGYLPPAPYYNPYAPYALQAPPQYSLPAPEGGGKKQPGFFRTCVLCPGMLLYLTLAMVLIIITALI